MNRRAWSHALLGSSVVAAGLAVVQAATAPAGAADWAFSAGVTATREHTEQDGSIDEDSKTSDKINVRVSDKDNLRGRQEVRVEWDGAHPTGGIVADPTSSDAKDQEYPVVVLQCRGIDTTGAVPEGQSRLAPENCWTQSAPERYFASASQMPVWRADAYAAEADRAPTVGAPATLPPECNSLSKPVTARWLPLVSADGEIYYGGPDPAIGCASGPPESSDLSDGGLPSNTTYGVTDSDGKGSVSFPLWTASENASIGCSAAVSCSLVVVPIVGLSCDAWGHNLVTPQTQANGSPLTDTHKTSADAGCRRSGAYAAGETRDSTRSTDAAVRGAYWWSASNWRNRVAVPLSFAPTGEACAATGGQQPIDIGGSVVLNELTASWRPAFCTTKSLSAFNHVQQADFFALDQVEDGTLSAAFASNAREKKFTKPVVPAPVTVGGFAIAFTIDDTSKKLKQTLNLNARLVAKLITQSYPVASFVRNGRTDLKDNPLNMSLDPEFRALNPGVVADADIESAGALQLLSDKTDLTTALTAWIDADPEAHAWISGVADPWGMTVNTNYRGKHLSSLDGDFLRDTFEAPESFKATNQCYARSPSPYLNLVSNPQTNLAAITLNLQYASSAVLTACNFTTDDPITSSSLKKIGRESIGKRFVLGLMTLSAADRYNLRTASLQTASAVPAGEKFTSAAGRTFVAPSRDSLKAATSALTVDQYTRVWTVDQSALRATADNAAYPGIVTTYMAVPTTGLSDAEALGLAKLLCYAVDGKRGAREGDANGLLPVGYLPLTEGNGLGPQRAYTLQAVSAIRNQTKSVPELDAPGLSYNSVCDFKVGAKPKPTPSTPTKTPAAAAPSVPPVVPPSVDAVPVSSDAVAPSSAPQSPDVVLTAGQHSLFGSLGAPLLLLLAFLAGMGGSALRWSDQLRAAALRARRSIAGYAGRHLGT